MNLNTNTAHPQNPELPGQNTEDQEDLWEKIEVNESLFQSFADHMPVMAWITDIRTQKMYRNQQWYEETGFSRDSKKAHSWQNLTHPDDLNSYQGAVAQTFISDKPTQCEIRLRLSDDIYRWYLLKFVGLKDSTGKIIKQLGTAIKIHKQKKKEELFRKLLMDVPASVIIYRGPEHYVDFINTSALKCNGQYDYAGKTYAEVFSSDQDLENTLKNMDNVYATGNSISALSYPMVLDWDHSGTPSTRYFNIEIQATHDENGKVNGLMCFGIDITFEHESKLTIESHSKWLQDVLDSIPVPLVFIEPASRKFGFINKAASTIASIEFQNHLLPGDYRHSFPATDESDGSIPLENGIGAKLVQGEVIENITTVYKTPTGRFDLLLSGKTLPEMYGHSKTIVLTFQDISKLKQIEADLLKSVHARDEFMSICSHELRTPITSLSLQIQLAKKRIAKGDLSIYEPDYVKNQIQKYGIQVERIVRLIGDILNISQLNSGRLELHREPTNLTRLVAEVLESISDQLQASKCTTTVQASPEITGNWDKFRLEQALINLLTNALRFGNSKPISIEVKQNKYSAFISIQDQGLGIAEHDQERIFERFERAISANEVSGLGLGLYIVKSIVCAHGGTIQLESALGKGSKFTLTLPFSQYSEVR